MTHPEDCREIIAKLEGALAQAEARADALRREIEDRRDRWINAAPASSILHVPTMQMCGTELRLMLERLSVSSPADDAATCHPGCVATGEHTICVVPAGAASPGPEKAKGGE